MPVQHELAMMWLLQLAAVPYRDLCCTGRVIGTTTSRNAITCPSGSAFMRGASEDAVWLDDGLYCNAVEPLLRLAARGIEERSFADWSGATGEAQVPQTVLCAH